MRIIVAGIVLLSLTAAALSEVKYEGPNVSAYLESLMQPDNIRASCCGEADAYYADEVEPCPPGDQYNCAFVAIITDTRPNLFEVMMPDGSKKTIRRPPRAVGEKHVVPLSKIRRPPSENPTEHNIIFISPGHYVICWEPVAKL